MRKNFGAKPWTYPQPVLMIATYGEDGTPDVMNVAWGGISDDTQIPSVSVRIIKPQRISWPEKRLPSVWQSLPM